MAEPTVTNALEQRLLNLLENSPRAMHPLWNYVLLDFVPILRWAEIQCNSSKILLLVQRLLKLPPLAFAILVFTALFAGLQKCLKIAPRLTANILAVAYPTYISFKELDDKSTNWITYWCVYGWSTVADHISLLLNDPIKSYYIPKMLFFYWMSSKGGSKTIYNLIIARIFKGKLANQTISDNEVDILVPELMQVSESVVMVEEELDDSILESVQQSENDECSVSVSDQSNNEEDCKSVDESADDLLQSINNADCTTLNEQGYDGIKSLGLKTFKTGIQLSVPTITISTPFDQAPEAAE